MIQGGVTFPLFADMVRSVYVDVARRELLPDPRSRTDSRVSLLTGVHRKELRRQREPEPNQEPPVVTRSSLLLARWLGARPYVDAAGQPLPLPRSGPAPSFENLVESVTRDVRARAVLDEWLAQGLVSLTDTGEVRLRADAYVPREGGEAQLFYFARNLHDHLAAAAANVSDASGQAPFLDRGVHYDGLSPEAASRLQALARDAAQKFLVEMNREALAIADADASPDTDRATRRVNLGLFMFVDDDVPNAP